MKKILILSCLILIIVSCQTEGDTQSVENESIDLFKIEQVYSLKGEAKIIAYRMLDANEKFHLWSRRHSEILDLEESRLNAKQIDFINELYSGLKIEYFEIDAKRKYTDYHYTYLPRMKELGLTIFTIEEMNKYFSNWNSETSYPHIETSSSARQGGHCFCNDSDDWCNTGTCFSWSCDTADIGCGWWLQEDCNGRCFKREGDE